MQTEYSKSPVDVAAHTARLVAGNDQLLARQRKIAGVLLEQPRRECCVICETTLHGADTFLHRGVPYVECGRCGHIQCGHEAPAGYPYKDQDFADIYRPLEAVAYRARTEAIYRPKLEWALRAAKAAGLGDLLRASWIEVGSGAGNFIAALREAGAAQVMGIDTESLLAAEAADHLGQTLVHQFSGSLADAVQQFHGDIYVAWFVLEHCFETARFLDALLARPRGTIFIASVPTFGLATLLEGAFGAHYARNLDSVLHLQLFTDRSIHYAMDRADCEIKAEWIFGQDADDLYRAIRACVGAAASVGPLKSELDRLLTALPAVQVSIDRAKLSDSRHFLAVRR